MPTHAFSQWFVAGPQGLALGVCLAICAVGMSVSAPAQELAFTTFDPPGSVDTYPTTINPEGAFTGEYYDGRTIHGFLRTREDKFITFDVPEALATHAVSINPEGSITG